MSSDEPIRSVPDELFRRVSAKAERQLPDALFGGPPLAAPEPEAQPEAASSSAAESGGGAESSPEESDGGDAEDDRSVAIDHAAEVERDGRAGIDVEPVVVRSGGVESAVGDDDGAADAVEDNADAAVAVDKSVAETPAPAAVSVESAAVADESVASAIEDTSASTATAVEAAGAAAESADSVPVEILEAPAAAGSPEPTAAASTESVVAVEVSGANAPDSVVELSTAATEPESVGGLATASAAGSSDPVRESVAVGEPGEPDTARPVLLVLADSLSYFGPKGGLPADDPRIWPNLVAAELDWDVELVGRIGWTCRDAYWALIGDPRVWAAVPRAGAVVFAVGGMDTLPSPLPTALRELIRYVRPPALRRIVRATYNWLQPKLSKLGRPVALPPKVSVDYLEQSRTALAQLRPDLPVVAVLPSVHNCDAYGRVHSGRPRAVAVLQAWSEQTSVPLVDLAEAVRDNIFSGEANPDGIHWGWAGHTAVANAMVKTLQEVR